MKKYCQVLNNHMKIALVQLDIQWESKKTNYDKAGLFIHFHK
jgi:hypothetical protein